MVRIRSSMRRLIVAGFPAPDPVVELVQGLRRPGIGVRLVAAEPADLALDAALLVGARRCRDGSRTRRSRSDERNSTHRSFSGALPAQPEHHRRDRAGEVVIADVPGRDAAEDLERFDVAFEERFLRLRGVDPVDGLAGVGQPEDEHVALRLHPGQATQTSPKSTSASAPGACSCDTNTLNPRPASTSI